MGDDAMDGVAHHDRRFSRIDHDDGFADFGATDALDPCRGCAREFVNIVARAWADRA